MALNPQQEKAVQTTEGPLLIMAGPGSGKTHTLVERIFYLISEKGIQPEQILVATFTEKAARELITRVSNRLMEKGLNLNLNDMYMGTIHSICLRILDENRDYTRLKRSYTLMDPFDQQYFLYRRLKQYKELPDSSLMIKEGKTPWNQSRDLMGWLNKISEEAVEVKRLKTAWEPRIRALGHLYEKYQTDLDEENALDFSTIQLETLKLLEDHESVLQGLQEKICYVMIDEYQDTNTIQELILFKLAGERANLCVVGDDDQGLYRFRGATIRNILEFPDHFPKGQCQQVKLTVNYRSHPDIIQFYNQWMEQLDWTDHGQTYRHEKKITPRPGAFSRIPGVVKVRGSGSLQNWYEEIYDFLVKVKASGAVTDWNQVAFLFKSVQNDKVVHLARFLEERGIPVYSPRSNLYFQREEVQLMMGAFLFLFPQFQENQEERYAIEEYVTCRERFESRLKQYENQGLAAWCKKKAKVHQNLVENTDYAFSGLFYELLQFPLFQPFLDHATDGGVMDSRGARNLAIFSQLLTKFEYLHHVSVLLPTYLEGNLNALFNQYFRFLLNGGINEYEDMREYAPSGCVSFLTIHQAKGMEFPVVVIGSLWDSPRVQLDELDLRLQHGYYRKPPYEPTEKMKEYDFWRLYYTAFSRAQNLLVLSCEESDKRGGVPRFPFRPLYDALPNWRSPAFKLEKLALEKIKSVHLKQQYSFTSHILFYENCPTQYQFFKELEFAPVQQGAMLFGTLVHQTLEEIHKAVVKGEGQGMNQEQIEGWFEETYAQLVKKERAYLAPQTKGSALKQVLAYVRQQGENWSTIKAAEVDVSLVKEGYILNGTVDLIRGVGDELEIIDFKSEKKPDIQVEKERVEQYRRQLEIYAHIVEERTGKKVSKLHLYYTGEEKGNPYLTFVKDPSSIDETIVQFDGIVERIEQKDFQVKKRPKKLCAECDMRHYCRKRENSTLLS